MLAVSTSTGGGTAFHYDQGDAGKPFARLERIVYKRAQDMSTLNSYSQDRRGPALVRDGVQLKRQAY